MKERELTEKLEQLRAELDRAGSLDPQLREQLQVLVTDIEQALDSDESHEGVLSDRTQDIVLKFEADHPTLTSALNRVASALANLGI